MRFENFENCIVCHVPYQMRFLLGGRYIEGYSVFCPFLWVFADKWMRTLAEYELDFLSKLMIERFFENDDDTIPPPDITHLN